MHQLSLCILTAKLSLRLKLLVYKHLAFRFSINKLSYATCLFRQLSASQTISVFRQLLTAYLICHLYIAVVGTIGTIPNSASSFSFPLPFLCLLPYYFRRSHWYLNEKILNAFVSFVYSMPLLDRIRQTPHQKHLSKSRMEKKKKKKKKRKRKWYPFYIPRSNLSKSAWYIITFCDYFLVTIFILYKITILQRDSNYF